MVTWLLAGLVLALISYNLPPILMMGKVPLSALIGPRDVMPENSLLVARARRAEANMEQNLPLFLALALLAMILPAANPGLAVTGAMIWVLARVIYIPLYLFGVPALRTGSYYASLAGLGVIVAALF